MARQRKSEWYYRWKRLQLYLADTASGGRILGMTFIVLLGLSSFWAFVTLLILVLGRFIGGGDWGWVLLVTVPLFFFTVLLRLQGVLCHPPM